MPRSPSQRLTILVLALMAMTARAGVDQGNPRMSSHSVYNLVHDYRIQIGGNWQVDAVTNPDQVRVDVVSTYRSIGHFLIAAPDRRFPATCRSQPIAGTGRTLYWIGVDCSHPFFVRQFESLLEMIRPVQFN